MANVAKNAILRAKLAGVITDLMPKTITDNVYVNADTTLTAYLATLATNADLETLQQAVEALGALAGKDKVSQADLDEALATLITGKADQTALQAEIDRATAAEEDLDGRLDTAEGNIATLTEGLAQGDTSIKVMWGWDSEEQPGDSGKSIRAIANEELAKQLVPEGAKESLDTLAEIAAWIQDHPDDASAMNEAITALQNKLSGIDEGDGTVKKYIDDAIAALNIGQYALAADLTALAGRVEALEATAEGLGSLATKDIVSEAELDEALKAKVNASAEANHSHDNKAELDKIADGDVAKWNAAEQNAKDYADGLNEAMDGRVKVVEGKAHEHANKDVLDGITADVVAGWNGKGNIYYSTEEPANLTENDLWVAIIE